MPSQVWEQRFSSFLAKAFARKESTALTLLEDVMPVAPVLAADAPELLEYRGERRALAFVARAAAAANFNRVCVRLSVTSPPQVVTVIERVVVWSALATGWRFQLDSSGNQALGGTTAPTAMDRRAAAGATGSAPFVTQIAHDQFGVVNPSTLYWRSPALAAGAQYDLPLVPLVIAPIGGGGLWIEADTANVDIQVLAIFRERAVGTAETKV